jgi:hypothetical protein
MVYCGVAIPGLKGGSNREIEIEDGCKLQVKEIGKADDRHLGGRGIRHAYYHLAGALICNIASV